MKNKPLFSVKEIALSGILIAMALGLSYCERFLNLQLLIPLPGVKLGLANLVTLTALYYLGKKTAFTVLILRCFLGALFGGGITGLAFSLTGGLLSMATMCLVYKLPFLSVYGVSILGAAAHSIGQIVAAMLVMGTVTVLTYLPFLLLVSVGTGFVTGMTCAYLFRAMRPLGLDR